MDVKPWYITAQCKTIRDALFVVQDKRSFSKDIEKMFECILVASYKIESDMLGIDVKDLMENDK